MISSDRITQSNLRDMVSWIDINSSKVALGWPLESILAAKALFYDFQFCKKFGAFFTSKKLYVECGAFFTTKELDLLESHLLDHRRMTTSCAHLLMIYICS